MVDMYQTINGVRQLITDDEKVIKGGGLVGAKTNRESEIKEFESFKNPLKISTESLITFSFKTVDIKVWSAPDKDKVILPLVKSVSSVKSEIPIIKSLAL